MRSAIEMIADAIIDPFFAVDSERRVVEFNRAFYSMLPRAVARGLKGKTASDVITFALDDGKNCIVTRCWEAGHHIRLDAIAGKIDRAERELTFILSAKPFLDPQGAPLGALVILRNVTDEAQVQSKYQEMLDAGKREREQLMHSLRERTLRLLETGDKLVTTQRELLAFRRRRLI